MSTYSTIVFFFCICLLMSGCRDSGTMLTQKVDHLNIDTNEFSLSLPGKWIAERELQDYNIYKGKSEMKYVIISMYANSKVGATNATDAVRNMNQTYLEVANGMIKEGDKIMDLKPLLGEVEATEGHVGIIPSKGLVFYRWVHGHGEKVVSVYMEIVLAEKPDKERLAEKYKEFEKVFQSVKWKK